ncbi:MAG: radical SAM protein [Leptospiraceae bacterium]|nr:radical SAM protein [Leptospiraceae bacterium]
MWRRLPALMLILDFYVDEPACFGVPPYLSPYCRYTAGAAVDAGVPEAAIEYMTVDQWRQRGQPLPEQELVVVIAGATVPGKYLGGKMGTVAELLAFLESRHRKNKRAVTLIGGPIRYASGAIRTRIEDAGGYLVRGDVERYVAAFAREAGSMRAKAPDIFRSSAGKSAGSDGPYYTGARHSYLEVDRWAPRGAFLTRLHPNFPYLILELETYRGCTRDVFCSFCTEAFYGKPTFRNPAGIFAEVAELARLGNRFFRLGRQADLMTYLPDMQDFQNSFPRPRPESLERLYSGIHKNAPDLELLHLDNINPGLIATFPEESRRVVEIISSKNTPGDTAAMGLESADPAVVKANDLKCSAAEAVTAIEIVNEFGARRTDGIPRLLPGLNFIHGLPGESERTFELNYQFLKTILDRGLLLRRINIRQAVTFEHTRLEKLKNDPEVQGAVHAKHRRPRALEERFFYYRERIRKEIDQVMLLRNFPPGTRLRHVIIEGRNQGYFFGRPLGSYPVTIKIPDSDPTARAAHGRLLESGQRTALTVIITGAEERSLKALCHPIRLCAMDTRALATLPGCGRKRAARLFNERAALKNFGDLRRVLETEPFATEADYDFRPTAAPAAP